jgi:hypothetical protein
MKRIAEAELVTVKPKQKVTEAQAHARQNADGFKIKGLRGIEWANLGYEGPRKLCIS